MLFYALEKFTEIPEFQTKLVFKKGILSAIRFYLSSFFSLECMGGVFAEMHNPLL